MPYPNYDGKHDLEAFITPQDYVKYARSRKAIPEKDLNVGVILCYQQPLLKQALETEETEPLKVTGARFHLLKSTENRVAICGGFGIGAPIAAIIMEELIAQGVKKFISIGTAGSLRQEAKIGDIVVCNRAIRDEGVSHHYLESGKYALPSAALTLAFKQSLEKTGVPFKEGATWTIDTPYRETVAEARHYQNEWVYTVEMEAAALCAVAQCRGVELATAFAISDSLADLKWYPHFDSPLVQESLYRLFEAAKATLLQV